MAKRIRPLASTPGSSSLRVRTLSLRSEPRRAVEPEPINLKRWNSSPDISGNTGEIIQKLDVDSEIPQITRRTPTDTLTLRGLKVSRNTKANKIEPNSTGDGLKSYYGVPAKTRRARKSSEKKLNCLEDLEKYLDEKNTKDSLKMNDQAGIFLAESAIRKIKEVFKVRAKELQVPKEQQRAISQSILAEATDKALDFLMGNKTLKRVRSLKALVRRHSKNLV